MTDTPRKPSWPNMLQTVVEYDSGLTDCLHRMKWRSLGKFVAWNIQDVLEVGFALIAGWLWLIQVRYSILY